MYVCFGLMPTATEYTMNQGPLFLDQPSGTHVSSPTVTAAGDPQLSYSVRCINLRPRRGHNGVAHICRKMLLITQADHRMRMCGCRAADCCMRMNALQGGSCSNRVGCLVCVKSARLPVPLLSSRYRYSQVIYANSQAQNLLLLPHVTCCETAGYVSRPHTHCPL